MNIQELWGIFFDDGLTALLDIELHLSHLWSLILGMSNPNFSEVCFTAIAMVSPVFVIKGIKLMNSSVTMLSLSIKLTQNADTSKLSSLHQPRLKNFLKFLVH